MFAYIEKRNSGKFAIMVRCDLGNSLYKTYKTFSAAQKEVNKKGFTLCANEQEAKKAHFEKFPQAQIVKSNPEQQLINKIGVKLITEMN